VTELKFTVDRNTSLNTLNYSNWYANSDRQKLRPVLMVRTVSDYRFILATDGNTQWKSSHSVYNVSIGPVCELKWNQFTRILQMYATMLSLTLTFLLSHIPSRRTRIHYEKLRLSVGPQVYLPDCLTGKGRNLHGAHWVNLPTFLTYNKLH
jgi:hypothetical protein